MDAQETESTEETKETTTSETQETDTETQGTSDETGATDWRGFVSDEFKTDAEQYNSLDEVFKRAKTLRQELSRAVVKPGDDADDAAWQAYYKKLGIPESVDGYKIERPEDLPEELNDERNLAIEKAFVDKAHELKVTPEQLQGLMGLYWEMNSDVVGQMKKDLEAYVEQSEASLRKEWGNDFERNREFANKFVSSFFEDPQQALQLKTSDGRFLLDNPIMAKAFAKVGRMMGEDHLGPVVTDEMKESIQEQIDAMEKEKQENWNEFRNSSTKQQKLNDLYAKLYGSEAA